MKTVKLRRANDSGQAATEFILIMLFLLSGVLFVAKAARDCRTDVTCPPVMKSFADLISGFGIYADSYDFVLSMPFP